MEIEPIPNILNFREKFIDFLKSINVNYSPGNRFEQSFIEIRRSLEKEKRGIRDFSNEAKLRHALSEIVEIRFILNNISKLDVSKKVLEEKFKLIISGERPVEKKDNNRDKGRDVVFELSLLSFLKEKGLDVYYQERGDILLKQKGKNILIECKRINGINARGSLKSLLRKANRQLTKERENIDFGIIAINIDNIVFNEGKLMISIQKDSIQNGFYSFLREFIDKHADLWQRRNIVYLPDFIPAVFVCLSGAAFSFKENITINAFFGSINNTSNPVSENFKSIELNGLIN